MIRTLTYAALSGTLLFSVNATAEDKTTQQYIDTLAELGYPTPKENELVHIPPTMEDLEDSRLHPELKRVIRRGHDLFTNTQQLRGENVFNNMNCSSCHLGEGRMPFSAPIWPAAVTLPDFRGKNAHVNNLEERIAGCFTYSMNGKPPEYGSDNMVALSAYHQWLAKDVPVYPQQPIYGRGFPAPERPEELSYARGEAAFQEKCSVCHGDDGGGLRVDGQTVFPATWGDMSNNWGAGMVRVFTAAGFIKNNMPLGQPNSLDDQEAWDIAYYMSSQERPQDPRYTGDVKETLEQTREPFHKHSMYGRTRETDGHLLGDHSNLGGKPFLKPDTVRPRTFE
ncbi:c-type cytochrome [Marinobacter orientalis]|uniref:C-type cytochrome n=1 Tax=Marinobacter orientalis TaxID=1928859 RepID=A0A7Y0REU7_9GAMM|nr:c-type cytochrome [Marinobacter orientalis]NMT64922.1 c-type cytochrome [Marinobacter orientalis]TGX48181.1 c-type cytochrome [Marinobacter orientalis]